MTDFKTELTNLINKHSMENGSNTPDFLLAEFIENMLMVFDITVNNRRKWYNGDEWCVEGKEVTKKNFTSDTGKVERK